MASLSDFRAAYPEFAGASDALVNAALDYGAASTSAVVWGEHYSRGVMLAAADWLALKPEAKAMRLESNGRSIYSRELARWRRLVAIGVGRVS